MYVFHPFVQIYTKKTRKENIFKSKSIFIYKQRVRLKMKEKKSIEEIKKTLGLDQIHPDLHWRERLERMIDPNKYYLVLCHSLPFKGSTILKRGVHPSRIIQDIGDTITKEQWEYFNELARKGEYITERKGIFEL